MKINILGVNLDQIDLPAVMTKIKKWMTSENQHYVATVNPEFVMAAQDNKQFKQVLNLADIAVCDGIGLSLVSGFKLKRVTGVEISQELLKQDYKIFLLGGTNRVGETVRSKFPQARIVGTADGGRVDPSCWQLEDNKKIIKQINESQAEILLVAFGQVKQEMWIYHNLDKLPKIKVAVGVGGTFDYLSGRVKRAPRFMQKIGLEWLFRLLTQPSRIGRIINATVGFSGLYLKEKLKK